MAQPSTIDSPAKRAKLASNKNPYWQGVSGGRGGVSLGYRRSARGPGSWVAKIVVDGRRAEARLGNADDAGANAESLSFPSAVTAALVWARKQVAQIANEDPEAEVVSAPTVRSAVEAYIAARSKRQSKGDIGTAGRLRKHVLADERFAALEISKLTARAIQAWRGRLTKNYAQTSVNRLLNDLRAALNAAIDANRQAIPATVAAEVRSGTKALSADANARKQVLPDAAIRRLIDAAFEIDSTGDFGRLILVMAATGARFSQIERLTVSDVQSARYRIMVPPSRKGRAAKKPTPIAVPVGADVIGRLQPVISNRRGDEPLLLHWISKQVGPVEWERVERRPWGASFVPTRQWAKARDVAELPTDIVMLCLRHSSIVRALSVNVPVRLVAALHDTSVGMIEQHYSAYIVDATEELARRAVTPLAPIEATPLRSVAEVAA
ncbi:site-specific integrase [Methylobacterium sp. Leaf466]|uniref:tyrosine-type recombinase/integrase n=1 Tax=Methylobacterium sp. Leaf466 TaxID=1736386 RepID=UPI0007012895|nr:site-specific integrase [Methylobacterium sp. Leaf466]KQT78096.1 integrase [Methylobacterium sp. Leaf466]